MVLNNYDIIIVGCGLSGIVIAERFALLQNKKILIIDKRNHIGGNCYDYYDEKTNILMNKYGAHLFHTNDEEVFNYINQYGNWSPWEHKVLGLIDDKYLPIPANITTVNEIFDLDIKNKEEMDVWLSENQVKYENITNGEEMAKSRVGEILYEKIFKNYTYKQWKKYPNELAPEVLARIPVRNSFDDRYFSDKYQVLPEKGYTAFFQSILDKHKHNIDVKLNCDFFDIKDQITNDHIVIYTGPIDAYFADKGLPKLEYRSIDFHIERKMNTEFYQPYSVVNYPGSDTPYTRCIEYKHFLKQKSDHTVYVKETTTDKGEPYYPVLNDRNKELYEKYQKMAEEEGENIHFIGRLASYKYFNMDQAIKNSLDYFNTNFGYKITKNINFSKGNATFEVFKKNGILNFIDYGGYETRNSSTMWCIQEANKLYKWKDFQKIKICTNDFTNNKSVYSYIKETNIKLVPDFVFHAWPEVGINDYVDFTQKIHNAGKTSPLKNKVGWIGNLNTHYSRQQLYEISQKHTDLIEIIPMTWKKAWGHSGKMLKSTKYISTPDLVSTYKYLIDIRGNGPYSARLKTLLWSHRPLLIVERNGCEYFEYKLEPWKHYIPVKHDLSDLIKNIKWCLAHEEISKKIAENAYEFSKKYLTREFCYNRWDEIISNKIIRTKAIMIS